MVDMFHNRIVFPIYDLRGDPVAFIGRVWTRRDATNPAVPKYLNSPDTPIYTKGQLLFGLHQQRDRTSSGWPPVVVEGPADAVAVWLAFPRSAPTGLVAAAPCGTALTRHQVRVLTGLPAARRLGITVAFDGDEGGRDGADRAFQLLSAHLLSAHSPHVPLHGVALPAGTDPADLLRTPDGPARLRHVLEHDTQPLLHLLLEHCLDRALGRFPRLLFEVEGRIAFARALAPLIAELPPALAVPAAHHLASSAQSRTPGRNDVAGQLLFSLTIAVCEYLGSGQRAKPSSR
jgi:DNA primase